MILDGLNMGNMYPNFTDVALEMRERTHDMVNTISDFIQEEEENIKSLFTKRDEDESRSDLFYRVPSLFHGGD